MSDNQLFDVRLMMGRIEMIDLPARWEGRTMIPRYRIMEFDGDGRKIRDEVAETGVRLIWPEDEPSWWDRLTRWVSGERNQ